MSVPAGRSHVFTRVVLIVLDGVGVGALPDADRYGDQGSNTLGNLARAVPLAVPTLRRLGLCQVVTLAGLDPEPRPRGAYGRMREQSKGKDSVTGHWELAGIVLDQAFPVFPEGFPADVIAELERRIGRSTIGNRVASGTVIIEELGSEHLRSGAPIVYTSADSVFQVAAHEGVIPPDELYRVCEIAYGLMVEGLGLARVIARPFDGRPGSFVRTPRRRDFARPAPSPTVLDHLVAAGVPVVAVGKISELFAGRGVTTAVHTASDDAGMDALEQALTTTAKGFLMANLVDFDTRYGHRNDPAGYAKNLEHFDARLSRLLARLTSRDLLMITADHGNDPTTASTDHSREYVPLLVAGVGVTAGCDLGERATFSDVGQTVAEVWGVGPLSHGTSFLSDVVSS